MATYGDEAPQPKASTPRPTFAEATGTFNKHDDNIQLEDGGFIFIAGTKQFDELVDGQTYTIKIT